MTRTALAFVLLSGCATAAPNAPSSTRAGHTTSAELDANRTTHPQDDVTCKDEVPTGTHLERRRCRSDAERAQDRQIIEQTWTLPALHRRTR